MNFQISILIISFTPSAEIVDILAIQKTCEVKTDFSMVPKSIFARKIAPDSLSYCGVCS